MTGISNIEYDKLYTDEFKGIGIVLQKHLPNNSDIISIQHKLIRHIKLAKGESGSADLFFDEIAKLEKQDYENCKKLNNALIDFKKVLYNTDVVHATLQTIEEHLSTHQMDISHLEIVLKAIEKASDKKFDFNDFWHKNENRGRRMDGKNSFALIVAEEFSNQLACYPTAKLASELLEVFGVSSTPNAINQVFYNSGIFRK